MDYSVQPRIQTKVHFSNMFVNGIHMQLVDILYIENKVQTYTEAKRN